MTRARHWQDTRRLGVFGSGRALPTRKVTNRDLLDLVAPYLDVARRRRGLAVARAMGIATRHIDRAFLGRREAAQEGNAALSARAIRNALDEAGIDQDRVAYLIGHTTTPDRLLPSNIADVAERLGYRGPFCEFRQACTGFVNASIFAAGLVDQIDKRDVVVIVGSEVGSVFFDPSAAQEDESQLINLMQMGDGAAAVIVGRSDQATLGHLHHIFHGQIGTDRTAGLSLRDGGAAQPWTRDGVAAFHHDFAAIAANGLDLFTAGLDAIRGQGVDLGMFAHIVPHQANGVMDRVLAPLLAPHRPLIATDAQDVGNTGSAATWLVFDRLCRTMTPGQRALALGAEATKFMFGGWIYER